MKNNQIWFTLIEIMLWVTLFSIVISTGFYAFSSISLSKIKLIEKNDIEKESFFFSEKLFEKIKKWWVIDYEEYFNRKVVWNTTFSWGHYLLETWFWNFWSWWTVWTNNYGDYFYLCRSWNSESESMASWSVNPEWWCWNNNLNNNAWSFSWIYQRFWQYTFQFIDHNSNFNDDNWLPWDEDLDLNIKWDDDDENLWIWPEVFSGSWKVQELYLLGGNKKTRTFFRWNVIKDPKAPSWVNCDFTNPETPTWSWCLWTIEFLKLNLKDWWIDHSKSWSWLYDWTPDTWIIDPNFAWTWWLVAWSNTWSYWVSLFPDSINISDLKFYLYPNKDLRLSWKEWWAVNFSPYLRISYKLTPSWGKRWWIKWKIPELYFSTTISLSDLFSQK